MFHNKIDAQVNMMNYRWNVVIVNTQKSIEYLKGNYPV